MGVDEQPEHLWSEEDALGDSARHRAGRLPRRLRRRRRSPWHRKGRDRRGDFVSQIREVRWELDRAGFSITLLKLDDEMKGHLSARAM